MGRKDKLRREKQRKAKNATPPVGTAIALATAAAPPTTADDDGDDPTHPNHNFFESDFFV